MEEAGVVVDTLNPMIGLMKSAPSRPLKFIVWTKGEVKLSLKRVHTQTWSPASSHFCFGSQVAAVDKKLVSL